MVAATLVVVVSAEQLLMELCVIDGNDESVDIDEDDCTPKSAVSSGFAFNTNMVCHQNAKEKKENFHCGT